MKEGIYMRTNTQNKKNIRIGERRVMNNGLWAEIVDYQNAHNIEVRFDTGDKTTWAQYSKFKRGAIADPNRNDQYIGLTQIMSDGRVATVTSFTSRGQMMIMFEDGVEIPTTYNTFIEGKTKHPNTPTLYGVGYIGVGSYKPTENGRHTKAYQIWVSMMGRAYNPAIKDELPTYENVVVCEEWHNFQNFAKWYEENYYEVDGQRMEVDKDILSKSKGLPAKIYSPETCLIVPRCINLIFTESFKDNGLPKGVNYIKETNKYQSSVTVFNGKTKRRRKRFSSKEEAHQWYLKEKKKYLKEIANHYREVLPDKVYQSLMTYQF